MTDQDLKQSLNMTLTNYGKFFDENIAALWKGLFINFDATLFKLACLKVISTNKFFPNASEIINAYQNIKQEAESERFERLKKNQKLLAAGQAYCHLCGNSGWCGYTNTDGYSFVARCVCSHGRDLNKFSESQINREHIPEIKEHYPERDRVAIKRGENPFYFPTVKEALKDDFAVFEARKKAEHLSLLKGELTDAQRAEILRELRVGA